MKILVINAGSSSLKYRVIDMNNEQLLVKGICEKIGSDKAIIRYNTCTGSKIIMKEQNIPNHRFALEQAIGLITDKETGIIDDINKINAIGHRIVHGGKYFGESEIITDEVIEIIKRLVDLAPLHNQAHVDGILACKDIFGDDINQVAVFDTAFHSTIPRKAYMFGIPYHYYEKYGIRKYGFHGISHKYVGYRCAKLMDRDIKSLKIITCHLGNGSSIAAIDKGKIIDTSMGLTPLGGVMMGTRCGSIDPSVVTFIQEKEGLSAHEINEILNKKSGLLGISGISNDNRIIMKEAQKQNDKAVLSQEMFSYQILKYIGAYTAVLKGCDAIVFTAGIGENQWQHRKTICDDLSFMGIEIDDRANKKMILGTEGKISSGNSQIAVYVIPTNEELIIARDTKECIENLYEKEK